MTTTRDAFEAWLSQGHSSGCNESMLKAWQSATAAERERCAMVCMKRNMGDGIREDQEAVNCDADIRQGGEHE